MKKYQFLRIIVIIIIIIKLFTELARSIWMKLIP
jgi:hypothetical protein